MGETYRADAITWMNGLREFGDFDIITWELQTPNNSLKNKILRILEYMFSILKIQKIVSNEKPDIVIAERATSYGFLAALSGAKIVIVAQQGISDLWPKNSILYPFKKMLQGYAFKKATLVHAWGAVMIPAMQKAKVSELKIMILPKGIDLEQFTPINNATFEKITAIVTRSLLSEYGHETILKAFAIVKSKNIAFQLTIVGDGKMRTYLEKSVAALGLKKEVAFTGKINNSSLPKMLQQHLFYISMSTTEGVSASLFEAMACKCFPIVSDIAGNQAFIKNNYNGILISINKPEKLADAIIVSFKNHDMMQNAVNKNIKFVSEHANYKTNMSLIAKKYHDLIIKDNN